MPEAEIAFGCEPDVDDPLQLGEAGKTLDRWADTHSDSPILSAAAPLPEAVSLLEHWPEHRFQGNEPACVGFTLAAGIQIGLRSKGWQTAPFPSPMWCWNQSRAQHQQALLPLTVSGTYLRRAIHAVQKQGWCLERDWPYEPEALESFRGERIPRRQARPPLSVVRKAYDHRGPKGYYRIGSFSQAQRANAAGLPAGFGILLDDDFLDPGGPIHVDRITPTAGLGHAMLMTGYQRFNGVMYAQVLNWWRYWRGSVFWMKADLFDATFDSWCMDVGDS